MNMFVLALEHARDLAPVYSESEMAKSVYIAGPIAHMPDGNIKAFNAEAKKWKDTGYLVANPAQAGARTDKTLKDIFTADLMVLTRCTNIMMLPGWERSLGASIERDVASYLGITIWHPYEHRQSYCLGWVSMRLDCGEYRVRLATRAPSSTPEFESQNMRTEWVDVADHASKSLEEMSK